MSDLNLEEINDARNRKATSLAEEQIEAAEILLKSRGMPLDHDTVIAVAAIVSRNFHALVTKS